LAELLFYGNNTSDPKRLQLSKVNTNDKDVESIQDLLNLFEQPYEEPSSPESETRARAATERNAPGILESQDDSQPEDLSQDAHILTTDTKPQGAVPSNPYKSYKEDIPPSLRKPFKIPFRSLPMTTVITPQPKTNPGTNYKKDKELTTPLNSESTFFQHTINQNLKSDNPFTEDLPQKTPRINKADIYISPLVTQDLKPRNEDVILNTELEVLRPLILSQHAVFTNLIKELGDTNLTFTKLIDKKKDSLAQLKHHKKIPRSLRIKCELTASPPYTSHEKFINLKEQLQDAVSEFINKGSSIMTEWATINIQLLLLDRCSEILQRAITILDGLSSYHADMIGNLHWSATSPFCSTLLLLKLYLQGNFGNAEAIVEHLELPTEDILTLAAKIITKNNSDEMASKLLQETNLSDLQIENENQKYYINETLTQFNQIMWTTTVDLWKHHKLIIIQTAAANNLKAKITALETIKATAATAAAITRATEKLQDTENRTTQENLRITNLEKGFRRQEQKTNELLNTLNKKNKNKNSKQKNLQGSHTKEPMASPNRTAPTFPISKTDLRLVDLTTEDELEPTNKEPYIHSPPYNTIYTKRQKTHHGSHANTNKSVQWHNKEINLYNPEAPASRILPSQFIANQMNPVFGQPTNQSFFPPAPAPPPLMAPSANPFVNQQQNIYTSGTHNHFLQNQSPQLNPFLTHANPNPNNTANSHKRSRQQRFPQRFPNRHQR